MASVNTNFGALVALQNLNSVDRELSTTQNRISTGLRVAGARDDGAAFAIAQGLRSRVGSVSAINEGISRATNTIDTALSAGGDVSDILTQLRTEAQRAATFSNPTDRQAAQDSFAAARNQIDAILNSATINGVNLLNGANETSGFNVVTSDTGSAAPQTVQQTTGADAADATVTAATTLSASTVIDTLGANAALTNVATNVQVGTNDALVINLQDASRNTTETIEIRIGGLANLGALQDAVSERTGGRVSLNFDGDNLVYDSNQNFSLNFRTGLAVDAAAGASDDLATVNARANFFTNNAAQFTGTPAAGTLGATSVNSSSRQTGGGQQLALTALASGQGLGTLASDLLSSGRTGTFTLAATRAAGNTDSFTFTVDNSQTIGQLLDSVSERTGGSITAAFDSTTRQIVFRAADSDVSSFSLTPASNVTTLTGNSAAQSAITRTEASNSTTNVRGYDFRVNGGALSQLGTLDLTSDPSGAEQIIAALQSSFDSALGNLGAQSRGLETQQSFLGALSDNLEVAVGSLVDADLARESARLQSLQVRQQLGAQALSIANQAPQIILSFFR
jgi:flagellin